MSAPPSTGEVAGPPAADVTVEEIDGRLAVCVPSTENILYLNETATAVWRLCDGTRSDLDVATAVAATYGQEIDAVDAAVRDLLRDLRAAGALNPLDTGA
jgi:hypothetical protein